MSRPRASSAAPEEARFAWVWTDELLDEWEEVIVREGKRSPESAASVVPVVRTL
jgi:hypothetical protein